jgi:hypothetical protein
MDPDRQTAASAILQDFALHRQVVLVTCHPDNAILIGGNTINIEGPTGSAKKARAKKPKPARPA